eukprot:gene8461-17439_t
MKRKANSSPHSNGANKSRQGSKEGLLVKSSQSGSLCLENGQELHGYSFGANKSMSGEVVFYTGMVGYPEALTDPSYCGQILVLTFPMVGNYGVPHDVKDEFGLPLNFESEKIQVSGLIVSEVSSEYSHWNAARSLSSWLTEAGVPALFGIDTRMLTKTLREAGTMLGKIQLTGGEAITIENPNTRHLVSEVSTKEIKTYGVGNTPHILAIDCGMKLNIVRYFVYEQKVQLTVVPHDYDVSTNPAGIPYDGLFISNGPGDPSTCTATIASVKWAMEQMPPKPVFGICLGTQIMALACGAKTYKMKYGNRGMNQPCIDLRTTRCYVTAQNHGYAIDTSSLPKGWKPLFINANDLSNEGIMHTSKPFFSVQFHPEACGGPMDTASLFATFVDQVRGLPHEKSMYANVSNIRKVLLVGSGGLSIGQ